MQQITITDTSYTQWVEQLSQRYRQSQIKAALKVNREMLRFYWSLGRDIVALKAETRWGSKFMKNLSRDLKQAMPDATCFSETNILYMKNFYLLYQPFTPQLEEQINIGDEITPQFGEQLPNTICPQPVDKIAEDLFQMPWGHHG